ncbi:zf-HC2 domain-containing protein [Paenibacillus sp. N1-5-1-14]|uniref:zf-HC2 domain-containing protein n=1 Tax=Paenibacillus radicibacter TaxID=2972488 RepID=UPI0021592EBC|nr:zf-HC2 domain-containing protein [Paenibacillus radicibacter]MCR8645143.1 zf-HC2 domain-containing protein [Paenibacillus radicibacter]
MKHVDANTWYPYIQGELDREVMLLLEEHLYRCPDCLETYLSCVEQLSSNLPTPVDPVTLTNSIMEQIEVPTVSLPTKQHPKKPASDRTRMLRNYFIAAAATILLMFTGIFQAIFQQVDDFRHNPSNNVSRVSDQLVEQTIRFLKVAPPKDPNSN